MWVYTPPGYKTDGESYSLLVLFDGEAYLDVMNVQKIPVGDPVVDLWVKRLHFVSIVVRLQSVPLAPGWLGRSPLL